jgi:hypothetical protein
VFFVQQKIEKRGKGWKSALPLTWALTGQVIEDAAGAVELSEAFFFGAKFTGVRDQAAAGAARRMLDVKHLVIEDVLDRKLRDAEMVHAAIEQNLIRPGIVAAELAPPAFGTPTNVRPLEPAFEIFHI